MRPPYQIDAIQLFKAIVGAQMQHLSEIVRQTKGRPTIDGVSRLPVCRCDDVLKADAPLHIFETNAGEVTQDQVAIRYPFALPVDLRC